MHFCVCSMLYHKAYFGPDVFVGAAWVLAVCATNLEAIKLERSRTKNLLKYCIRTYLPYVVHILVHT